MTAEERAEQPDAVGAEFTRLVDSLTGWLRSTLGEQRSTSEECRYCPVCRALAAVRGERLSGTEQVDLAERLGTVADTVTGLVRTWLEHLDLGPHPRAEHAEPPGDRAGDADRTDGAGHHAGARPTQAAPAAVEQIDIS